MTEHQPLTVPQIPFTQPSQFTQLTQDGYSYTMATGDDFLGRLQCWQATVTDHYQVQCAFVFKAGETINLGLMEKEPDKFKEVATKYKQVVEEAKSRGIITNADYVKMQKLKKRLEGSLR